MTAASEMTVPLQLERERGHKEKEQEKANNEENRTRRERKKGKKGREREQEGRQRGKEQRTQTKRKADGQRRKKGRKRREEAEETKRPEREGKKGEGRKGPSGGEGRGETTMRTSRQQTCKGGAQTQGIFFARLNQRKSWTFSAVINQLHGKRLLTAPNSFAENGIGHGIEIELHPQKNVIVCVVLELADS